MPSLSSNSRPKDVHGTGLRCAKRVSAVEINEPCRRTVGLSHEGIHEMNFQLILMRHAKSTRSSPPRSDHARPLSERGIRDARRMGSLMLDQGLRPNLVLCSTAERTRQTWKELPGLIGSSATVVFEKQLYNATPEEMLECIQGAGTEPTLLVLGHNPSCAILARELARNPPSSPEFDKFPTCATAVLAFNVANWAEPLLQRGRIEAFMSPKDFPAK